MGSLRRLGSPRLLVGAAALVALIVAAVLLLTQQTAHQNHGVASIFEDEALLVDQPLTDAGSATVLSTMTTLKALGVQRVRVIVDWNQVAPAASSSVRPAHFDASDPADYAQDDNAAGVGWVRYDRVDVVAAELGIKVYFDLAGPAPAWASAAQPAGTPAAARRYSDPGDDTYRPSVAEFEAFAQAAGRRFSGTYRPPDDPGHSLPRVSFWSVWNEPNQPGWLAPQYDPGSGHAVAPALYRSLAAAAWTGLVRSGHGPRTDTLLVGELAPSGCVSGRHCSDAGGAAYAALPPLTFLEDLYCVGPRGATASPTAVSATHLQRLSGAAARAVGCPSDQSASRFVAANPALFDPTGLAEHPYSFFLAPNVSDAGASDAGFVPLADLSRLESTLDATFALYGSSRHLPLYLTEYGYVTNPPNPLYDVTPAQQATFLNEAQYMAVQNPRVRALAQFELQDSNPALQCGCAPGSPGYWHNFEEGLEFLGGAHKPAFGAYRLPIDLPGLESGTRTAPAPTGGGTQIWGLLRPAVGQVSQVAQIEFRGLGAGAWQVLANASSQARSGIIDADVTLPASGAVRLAWTPVGGRQIVSRAVAVTVR